MKWIVSIIIEIGLFTLGAYLSMNEIFTHNAFYLWYGATVCVIGMVVFIFWPKDKEFLSLEPGWIAENLAPGMPESKSSFNNAKIFKYHDETVLFGEKYFERLGAEFTNGTTSADQNWHPVTEKVANFYNQKEEN